MYNLIPKTYLAAVNIGQQFTLGEGGTPIHNYSGGLSQFINPLIADSFVLAGVILLILLIFGGVTYIMNAGSGDKDGMEKGANALTSALIGFIIIFAAYLIIRVIEYVFGVNIFESGL